MKLKLIVITLFLLLNIWQQQAKAFDPVTLGVAASAIAIPVTMAIKDDHGSYAYRRAYTDQELVENDFKAACDGYRLVRKCKEDKMVKEIVESRKSIKVLSKQLQDSNAKLEEERKGGKWFIWFTFIVKAFFILGGMGIIMAIGAIIR